MYDDNQSRHTRDHVSHTRLLVHAIAYSRSGAPSEILYVTFLNEANHSESHHLLGSNRAWCDGSPLMFPRNIFLPSSRSRGKPRKRPAGG
jgi:hypothetical protein